MLKVYALIFILGILGTVGYGAKYYYDSTQATIATLRENNAKLETAVQISEDSMNLMKAEMVKNQELMNQLNIKLQKAEAYGDELRAKFSRYNLVQEALKNAEKLEGKMNGATAKLWRGIEKDTGGAGDKPLPDWLQPVQPASSGTGDQSSDKVGENNSSNSGTTETSTVN